MRAMNLNPLYRSGLGNGVGKTQQAKFGPGVSGDLDIMVAGGQRPYLCGVGPGLEAGEYLWGCREFRGHGNIGLGQHEPICRDKDRGGHR